MLRADNATFSFTSAVTNNAFLLISNAASTALKSFVFGASKVNASRTTNFCSNTLADKADLRAKRRTFSVICKRNYVE